MRASTRRLLPALHTPPHRRAVSLALVVQVLGATKHAARLGARRGGIGRFSSLLASSGAGGGGSAAAAARDVAGWTPEEQRQV